MTQDSNIYTSNAYLVTGTWNALSDRNTLIDTGTDPAILEKIEGASTGVGKKRVEQIVLTHLHYDHTGMLEELRRIYNPVVFAFSASAKADVTLHDTQHLDIGDRVFEVIHAPVHSNDSICLYCAEEKVVFSGDTCLKANSSAMTRQGAYLALLERLSKKNIHVIYPGHGLPQTRNCNDQILESRDCVRGSRIRGENSQ